MIITSFDVANFRNITQSTIKPDHHLNLVSGSNGSGKSTLLEAIQCLSMGYSFRTRRTRELIKLGQPSLQLSAILKNPVDARVHRAGLEKRRDGNPTLRLDFEDLSSQAEITRLLPVKAITPDSHKLIQDGPEFRRQYLDWGVFHVEPQFLDSWRSFKRSLMQRNQLLRMGGTDQEVEGWSEILVQSAQKIDQYRRSYLKKLESFFLKRIQTLDTMFHVELNYRCGWSHDHDLADLLVRNLQYHRKMKTTTDGPHRAELTIKVEGQNARSFLSRGQQKLIVYLLHMAQLDVLDELTGKPAIVLCDDIESEVDRENTGFLIEQLLQLESQIFVSGVNLASFAEYPHKGFHVERGSVKTLYT
ncbi:MAG: DNA replication/repair protein RecF [Granulosicoccus sp.]